MTTQHNILDWLPSLAVVGIILIVILYQMTTQHNILDWLPSLAVVGIILIVILYLMGVTIILANVDSTKSKEKTK